ncbi:MAG: NADH-quinone oxidoreductase subunit NuoI [Bacteroides sp.]|nr:MAG: NADH-quinone oxidoreductase subunit NuoI [Bacteroides sp.]
MLTLTNRKKILSNKPMTWMEKIYLPSIINGLKITIRHLFKKKITIQYPEDKRVFSTNFRGLHSLKRDEYGRERCTACGLCALACPAEAITMISAERKDTEVNLYREEKYAKEYTINMLRCIFCGLCEEACPKKAIYLDGNIPMPDINRENFIFTKEKLLDN